ncbi:putative membrane protein [Streptomonospora nanhaiensis]|uniref:Putative membrane protein n=1 Tax=Streptomonospora nanhaiensis TaxID=1323731 RepID=A0A853BLI9_9ACTN|nr:putative membrane protein [Streptomonospora nanhaiensis]
MGHPGSVAHPASPAGFAAAHHGAPGGPPGGASVRFLPPSTGPQGPHHGHPGSPGYLGEPDRPRRPEPDITRGAHRTHWATVPFQVVLVTVVFIALPGPLLSELGLGWLFLATVALACGTTAFALLSWWQSSFGLREDHLVVHSGLVRRSSREIPLSRLQAVDVVRPLLMQVLGLAELRVELAGGDASEIRLRYLRWETAERFRAALLAHAAGLSGSTPEAPEAPFYKLPFGLLLAAMTFRLPVLGATMLFLLLVVAGFAMGEPGVLGGAIPLMLGLMRGFLGPLTRYTDFYASLSPDGLRLRYGVFQARMQTVPPDRVQAVRIVEPLLWRSLGVVRVEANVAGYVGERQMDSSTLLPVAPRELAYALVDELFPGTDARGVALHPALTGRPRDGALGVDEHLYVARRGRLCEVTEIVPHARTQTIRMSAGPLARRRGVAEVDVDTPPGPIRARATGREITEARRVVEGMAAYGHDARRRTPGPERWATRSDTPAADD